MNTSNRILVLLVAVMMSALSAGCATTTGSTTEDKVRTLAQERWDLVIAGEYVKAYEYYSPGYRSTVDLTDYIVEMKLRRVKWISSEFKEIACKENVCNIQWNIGYQVSQPVPGLQVWRHFTPMQDDWIQLNGKWWYVPPKPTG